MRWPRRLVGDITVARGLSKVSGVIYYLRNVLRQPEQSVLMSKSCFMATILFWANGKGKENNNSEIGLRQRLSSKSYWETNVYTFDVARCGIFRRLNILCLLLVAESKISCSFVPPLSECGMNHLGLYIIQKVYLLCRWFHPSAKHSYASNYSSFPAIIVICA